MDNVEIFAGDRAKNYDDFAQTWVSNYQEFMQFLPPLLLSKQANDILVVGCGTGTEIKALTDASSHWQIVGVDPSCEMIAQAKIKLANLPQVTLIEGVVGDLSHDVTSGLGNGLDRQPTDSSQEGRQFDIATLLLVLHFIPDNGAKLAMLKDIADKLKPTGALIVLDIMGDEAEIKTNLAILKATLPANVPEEIVQQRLSRIQNKIQYVTESRFIELCSQAGFVKPTRFFQSTIYQGWILNKR